MLRRQFVQNTGSTIYPPLGREKRGSLFVATTPPTGLAPINTKPKGILRGKTPPQSPGRGGRMGSAGNTPRALECAHCLRLGHGYKDCPTLPSEDWKPSPEVWAKLMERQGKRGVSRRMGSRGSSANNSKGNSRNSSRSGTPRGSNSGSPREFTPRTINRVFSQLKRQEEAHAKHKA